MASKRQVAKARGKRKDEVEDAGIFALKSLRDTGDFTSFCQQLEAHARQGADFAQLISTPSQQTQNVQHAYTTLAEKALRLQQEQPDEDTSLYLRAMLVKDLLSAHDAEKYIHATAMPVNFQKRALTVGAWAGGLALAGVGLAFLGDAVGGHLTEEVANRIVNDPVTTQAVARTLTELTGDQISANFISALGVDEVTTLINSLLDAARVIPTEEINQLVSLGQATGYLDGTTAFLANAAKSSFDMHLLDMQPSGIGLNQITFALLGGGVGALATSPGAISASLKDMSLANAYAQNIPAASADLNLHGQALSEKFQLAVKLYHGDLTTNVKQEADQTAAQTIAKS